MCLRTAPRYKSECIKSSTYNASASPSSSSSLMPLWGQLVEDMATNCSESDSVYVTFTEWDAINTVHEVTLNTSWDYLDSIDPSNYDFPNEIWLVKPISEIIIKTSVYVPVVIGGVALNLIILVTMLKNKWLWTSSNFLIFNLASTDLVTLIFGPWMLLLNEFLQTYVLGSVGCRLEGFVQGTMLLASVGAVMLVSYDRLAAAVLPSEARITKSAAPKLIAVTWVVAALVSAPLAIFREYRERQWQNYLEIYCTENIKVLPLYWHVLIIALVWLPLGVMVITYATILYRLERCAKELSSRGGGVCVVRARGRAVRVTACILMVAVICRMPFTVLVYWRNNLLKSASVNSVEGSFQVLWFAAHYLVYMNCAINPLIYGFTNERYRRAMDRTPGIAWCRFGSWCCTCSIFHQTSEPESEKPSEKIFIVTDSPKPNKKISQLLKNILHVNSDHHTFTIQKTDVPTKTRVTPLTFENI